MHSRRVHRIGIAGEDDDIVSNKDSIKYHAQSTLTRPKFNGPKSAKNGMYVKSPVNMNRHRFSMSLSSC